MSSYTIRVELHDAIWQNYTSMAADLATKGITDLITADDGTHYKLSPAEYNYVGPGSLDDVFNTVTAAATKTGKRHAVFVTEAQRRKWQGLAVAQTRRVG
jgi:hypothetical protein